MWRQARMSEQNRMVWVRGGRRDATVIPLSDDAKPDYLTTNPIALHSPRWLAPLFREGRGHLLLVKESY